MEPVLDVGDKPVPVEITVSRGHNLQGSKNFSFHTLLRIEFNGSVLGESDKRQDVSVDHGVDYDFTCSFNCPDTMHTLDHLAHKPLIFTVIEILPKEKKQKERTNVLGQAVLDLLPLLHGQCSISSTIPVHPVTRSPLEATSLEDSAQQPSLEVSVSVPNPLLSKDQLLGCNLLKVTVETAFSVPEVWHLSTTPSPPSSTYVVALQVPLTADKEQVLMFPEGLLKAGGEREAPGRPKKWPLATLAAPGAQVVPGAAIHELPIDEEAGELTGAEFRDFRCEAETAKKRVCWDTERRCFLNVGGAARLSQMIEECRLWPVEIMACSNQGMKGMDGNSPFTQSRTINLSENELQISFHGVAYMDMGPLLYPGATRIRGAYKILPFSETELMEKTKRARSVLKEQVARAAACQGKLRAGSAVGPSKMTTPKTLDGANKAVKDMKEMPKKISMSGGPGKPLGGDSFADLEPQSCSERQMYTEARTYIILEISLEKPLVPKRAPAEVAKKVMELIPLRTPIPRRSAGAEKAVQEFHRQVSSVVSQILDQYQQLFGAAFLPGANPLDPSMQEQRRIQLLGELNYSGKYFAFKEQLKSSVVRIVREKMLRTEPFSDKKELQGFLSQLYVYLVDQMHVALNKTLTEDVQEAPLDPVLDIFQLGSFAREAMLNGDHQLAAHYYRERLARQPKEPSHWFDYGTLYLLTGDNMKAEECFQQAVSLQEQSHQPSLMMCGILAEMGGRYKDAELYLEGATCIQPPSVVAWTVFGLFHQGQNNHFKAEMSLQEAGKLLKANMESSLPCRGKAQREKEDEDEEEEVSSGRQSPLDKAEGISQETDRLSDADPDVSSVVSLNSQIGDNNRAESTPPRPSTSIYMETAQFLLQNYALQMVQRALGQELLCSDGILSTTYHLTMARMQLLSEDYSSAAATLREVLNLTFKDPEVWALCGHCSFQSGELREARGCYERSLNFQQEPSDTHTIFLRLGSIYLQEKQYESAKATYLSACSNSPSCLTWLGVGIACYRLEELVEAEDALTEANTLNNMNPEVWGYLALLSLKSGRRVEAEQSYKYVVKLNLQNKSLLREIKELQDRLGFGDPSF